jgi:murein DD-endopeptidase MepM/ murein hydrolase activator NlpD
MRKLGISTIVVITAVVTAVLTSLFWLALYSAPSDAPAAKLEEAPSEAEIAEALNRNRAEVAVAPSGLAVPVAGMRPERLTDTYAASRAGGARVHNAIDIMAASGTPVVAAADGIVERLHFSQGGGGITVYVRSPDRAWTYYYAHLQGYAPGLHEGQQVRRGDAIGLVGSTGNASAAGPHLHFAINRMGPGDRWWQGTPINPYPLLAGRTHAR